MNSIAQLPTGKTCGQCVHYMRCADSFHTKAEHVSCVFLPIRFVARPA